MDNVTMTVILSLVYLTLSFTSSLSQATSIEIQNNCSYTVWAAATPGGGKQLNQGETWTLYSVNGSGRIWGRTNCVFGHNGRGKCESGDCGGRLECEAGANGRAPNTLAEYSMNQSHSGNDVFFVSVVEGFNIPMEFTTSTPQLCSQLMSKCMAEVNEPCPVELRDPGGCNNPCTVFRNSQFCCTPESICEPTSYSKFFKELCPEARTYPSDDSRSYCPNGVGYKVVFCPSISTDSSTNLGSTVFDIWNNCPYTVWAAAVPGGGRRLERGQNWTLSIPMGQSGKIWGRTNCTFDRAGLGRCETGDCDGKLQCQRYGQPPVTLAEYALSNNFDFIDISLVDGFNVGMDFSPTSPQCTRGIRCVANITDECPAQLKAPRGGCNGPCAVFQTDEYCCISGNCGPTDYSKFFKTRCPDAYTYPKDDETGAFGCPGGTKYKVVFCGN